MCAISPKRRKTPRLEFEAASIKPSGPLPPIEQRAALPRIRSGPGYFFFPRQALIQLAEANQVFIPNALKDERYDINAKAPDGTTTDARR